jgi:hypothetical protein
MTLDQYRTRAVLTAAKFKAEFEIEDSGCLDACARQPTGGVDGSHDWSLYGTACAIATTASRDFLVQLYESAF